MERRNVTLSIPRQLLKQAKIIAASQDKSLSQFFSESLEEKVREKTDYSKAQKRQMWLLKKGLDSGTMGQVKTSRDDLHVRE
ncbi:MAG: CopG family transcriptional regulator [Deltaproteobacteria bacterium]|nr:CopG family transcriptional regulator [Deltaproteobacteria bacterium]MBW1932563.1 CopG family transcriptional regulator [Deltaproteobacteria bacterium]MBW1937499.1 CopG family transcriptional regulator [Deltaproteobacteria bacterium]MBW1964827.1 CopG family transcriptional regulator [Deltaproteobacteria bacterium]MBW2079878.1 CopG family transcriptional regulator [Deltaproteobacteria bacterium]